MGAKKLDIYQSKKIYRYNSDSLFLYAFARNFLKNHITLLDIGAGSGILGLLCARDFELNLILNELNPLMAELCALNASKNALNAEILQCDILEAQLECVDAIISNPPFYRKDVINPQNENIYLAKKSENLPLDSLCSWVKSHLKRGGKFIFCYDTKEINAVFHATNAARLNIEAMRFVYPRESKNASLAMFVAAVSKSQTKIYPPLYNFVGTKHSSEVGEIFAMCNTCSHDIED